MKEYLDTRQDLYVVNQSLMSSMSSFNDPAQIERSIERTLGIINEALSKMNKLSEYSKEAEDTFSTIVNGLSSKVASMESIIDAYRSNMGIIKGGGSINIINLEECTFNNTAYSPIDLGVIMES